MILREKTLVFISLGYIYIPIVLYLFGWTNIGIAAMCIIAIGYVAYKFWKNGISNDEKNEIVIEWWLVVCVFLFFAIVGYFAGWGRFVNQTSDWQKHNAVLKDLVNRRWPVYYANGKEHSMLVYYIAHYLVPAFIGKMFRHSYRIAEIALNIWSEIGLLLVYFNLVRILKVKNRIFQVGSALLLTFWGIPLWLSEWLLKRVLGMDMLGSTQWFFYDEGILIQYSNNFTLLAWVVPQVVAVWLILLLFWENKDKIEYYMFLLLPVMLFGTLPFVGIVPIAGAGAVEWCIKNRSIRRWLRKIFSRENIVLLLTLGSVFFLYFYGNVISEKPDELGFMVQPYTQYSMNRILIYVIFIAVNILTYAMILANDNGKDAIFLMSVVVLCVLPIFKMGKYNDLCMRGSIPGLFFLMFYAIKYINEHFRINEEKWIRRFASGILIILILNGMSYSFSEFFDSISSEDYTALGEETQWESLEMFANRDISVEDDIKYNYYAYDIDNNMFQRFATRKHYWDSE